MTEADNSVEGGCSCGAVRYALRAKPMIVHACHCTDCQRLTGSAFVLNAWIERDQVRLLSGEPVACKLPTGQRGGTVYFCGQCRTYVWTEYTPGFRFVRVGTLDDPKQFAPDMHIWTRSKQPWLALPEGVRAFETYYDRDQEWPADSLARLAAVVG